MSPDLILASEAFHRGRRDTTARGDGSRPGSLPGVQMPGRSQPQGAMINKKPLLQKLKFLGICSETAEAQILLIFGRRVPTRHFR